MTRQSARALGVLAVLATAAVGGCSKAGTSPAQSEPVASGSAAKSTYTVYLSNNFLGNDFRVQMIKTAELAVTKAPLQGKIDLKVENSDNNVPAQIASLNSIILKRPDAIIVDPGSPTGLNGVLAQACSAGILVIAFDQAVTAPCAYNLGIDWPTAAQLGASWMAKTLNGEGKVLLDTGLAGVSVSDQISSGFKTVLDKNSGIAVAGRYEGKYAQGPEQQGVASLLGANPKIDGILTQGYGTGAIQALKSAGRPLVPLYAQAYNGTFVACAQQKVPCIITSNPPWIAAEALRYALEIKGGQTPPSKVLTLKSPCFITNDVQPDGATCDKIELGKNAYPDLSPGLSLPVSPPWTEIRPAEVTS